jgi:biopolymer transport protein ExbD
VAPYRKNSIEVAVQEDGSYLVNGISLASSSEAELPICPTTAK